MSTKLPFNEFERPRTPLANLPADVSDVLLRFPPSNDIAAPDADPAEARPCPAPDSQPYFEIYRAERVSLTSILFSGGDWRWRFCSGSGAPIAVSVGYASERECAAAVAALRSNAGRATVRIGPLR